MKKNKGIGLVAIIIIIVLIFAVVGICVWFIATRNKNSEISPETLVEDPSAVEGFLDNIKEAGKENSKANVGNYVMLSEKDLGWEDTEGGVKIISYSGNETTIEIPSTINGKNVVEIGKAVFSKKKVKGVKLPNTLKTIGEKAFYYCTELVEVSIGEKTETIGTEAFEGCIALKKVDLNKQLIKIGYMSFANCSSLKEVKLPNTVEEISQGAFCLSGLESIIIPGSVREIGKGAFASCAELKEVKIEEGLEKLEESKIFEACKKLVKMEMPQSIKEINRLTFMSSDNVTIYARAGSEAINFAKENNIKYVEE